jgi:hypothetical protein
LCPGGKRMSGAPWSMPMGGFGPLGLEFRPMW